jgi:hypothetical protein
MGYPIRQIVQLLSWKGPEKPANVVERDAHLISFLRHYLGCAAPDTPSPPILRQTTADERNEMEDGWFDATFNDSDAPNNRMAT